MRRFNPNENYGKPFVREDYLRSRVRKVKYTDGSPLSNISWNSDVFCVWLPLFLPADIAHALANDPQAVSDLIKAMVKYSKKDCTDSVEFYNSDDGSINIYRGQ